MIDSSGNVLETHELRFVKIETKVSYQEKTVTELNDVVVAQSRAIDKLERRVKTLEQQLEALLGQVDAQGEKPPHY